MALIKLKKVKPNGEVIREVGMTISDRLVPALEKRGDYIVEVVDPTKVKPEKAESFETPKEVKPEEAPRDVANMTVRGLQDIYHSLTDIEVEALRGDKRIKVQELIKPKLK